jgi:hypothetical protein
MNKTNAGQNEINLVVTWRLGRGGNLLMGPGAESEMSKIIPIRFSGSDLAAAESLRKLPAREVYGLRKFPAPQQYHDTVEQLAAVTQQKLRPRLFALAQRDWHVRGQTGCMFARLAALAAAELRWDYLVVPTTAPGGATYRALVSGVNSAARDPGCEVVSILFSKVTLPIQAVEIVYGLACHRPFWLERDKLDELALQLFLRYLIPNTAVNAWVMAFAPFSFIPNTRRAPYFELAIRAKVKEPDIFHRLNQDRMVAHLADAPLTMPDKHREDRWHSTLRRTRMILGGEPDHITAAKSTLVVPVGHMEGYTRPHASDDWFASLRRRSSSETRSLSPDAAGALLGPGPSSWRD